MFNKDRIEFFFFINLTRLLKILGLKGTRKFARFIGTLIYFFIPIRKETVLNNLRIAFPQKTEKEIKKICRNNYINISITFLELMLFPYLEIEHVKQQVKFSDLEIIKETLKEGKGLILLTGHFGNWELLVLAVSANIKMNYNILVKPQRNKYITEWLKETRHKGNINIIPLGISVKEVFKALQKNEVVGIAGDQRGHVDSRRYNFFDHPTALYTGPASIALKTSSPVIMVFYKRTKEDKYICHVEKLNTKDLPENYEDQVVVLTERYMKTLEKVVAENPEQYFWMHKLWKY
mgnify:CR=1 FL=1